MSPTNQRYDLTQLRDDLHNVHTQVATLQWVRMMYHRVREMIAANPRINKPSLFYDWITHCYAMSAAAGARRLLDKRSDTASSWYFLLA